MDTTPRAMPVTPPPPPPSPVTPPSCPKLSLHVQNRDLQNRLVSAIHENHSLIATNLANAQYTRTLCDAGFRLQCENAEMEARIDRQDEELTEMEDQIVAMRQDLEMTRRIAAGRFREIVGLQERVEGLKGRLMEVKKENADGKGDGKGLKGWAEKVVGMKSLADLRRQ